MRRELLRPLTVTVIDPSRHRASQHVVAMAALGLAVAIWLWPVCLFRNVAVPGNGAGDNVSFVWNLWWTQHALSRGVTPLWTPALFAPFGVSLLLHTNTLLTSFVAAPLVTGRSLLAATNAIIAVHLFLNCALAYALAFRLTRSVAASLLAGALFGWSPYIGAHLLGHFNLVAAWILPLTVLLTLDVLERRASAAAQILGLNLGLSAYIDYYYAVYAAVLVGLLVGLQTVSLHRRTKAREGGVVVTSLAILAAAAVVLAVAIAITGGTTVRVGSIIVSMRGAGNSIAAAGLLLFAAALVAFAQRLRVGVDWFGLRRCRGPLLVAIAIAAVAVSPLLLGVVRLWWHGDYASQRYLWRSAPPGVDVATLVLGNPRSLLWGGIPLLAYTRLGIDKIEAIAWLTPGAVLLSAAAISARHIALDVRRWMTTGALFFLWALGPYLVAFGHQVPVVLPATLIRYVPIVANARIPARAMVVVYLSIAMLSAHGIVALRTRGRTGLALLFVGLTMIDLLPAPPPIYRPDHPPLYDMLRNQVVQGAVCELPMGLRDGFGEVGHFDNRTLWYQTIHERGIVGGFVARLPNRIVREYEGAPILGSFLRLSSGQPLDRETAIEPQLAAQALAAQGVRFLILNRRTSPPDLISYIRRLNFRSIAHDDERDLLVVEDGR